MTLVRDFRVRVAVVRANLVWRLAAPVRSLLHRRNRIGHKVLPLLERIFPRLQRLLDLAQGDSVRRYQAWIAAYDTIGDGDLAAIKRQQSRATPPVLSIMVPVVHATAPMLDALTLSLRQQVHERWELCFIGEPPAGDGANSPPEHGDARIRSTETRATSTSDAWNGALRSAAAEFAVLVDPRVAVRPHSLVMLARTIAHHPDTTLVYADDDVVDDDGVRTDHYFKPDWNEALFSSQNYFGGLVAFRRSLALAVGGFREELDGDCAWGLFLRMAAAAPRGTIRHLPFVLSHRTALAASHPRDDVERRQVALAVGNRLAQLGRQVQVEPVGESSYRTRPALPDVLPTVSVIVPTTGRVDLLRPCVEGVLDHTSYRNLEVLLVVNTTQQEVPERREYLTAVATDPRVRVLFHEDRPFNFSWVNNWGVGKARGELLCFLNDDTEVIGSDWLSAMVAHVLTDGVAAVGAMLFHPDDTIQHAGVILGAGGVASHSYKGRPRATRGYHDRALVDQDVSCVTAACMLVQRDLFLDVGGFDEALVITLNDVDLCLRLREAGWRILWTPSAKVCHRESASISRHDAALDQRAFEWDLIQSRWSGELISDPHYSPNLSLDPLQLWEPAFPPRVSYPWRAARA